MVMSSRLRRQQQQQQQQQQLRRRWCCEQQLPRNLQRLRHHHHHHHHTNTATTRSLQYRTIFVSTGGHLLSSPSRLLFSSDKDTTSSVGAHTNNYHLHETTTRASTAASQLQYLSKHQLRIAIVGGGAAGMAAALHLSPLVAAGLVCGPIDVYESSMLDDTSKSANNNNNNYNNNSDQQRCSGNEGHGRGKQVYPGSGAVGRDIGVGLWSSAWWPFLKSVKVGISSSLLEDHGDATALSSLVNKVQKEKNRLSYRALLQDLEACGSYVGNVGYRTPDGSYLVKSELNASPFGVHDLLSSSSSSSSMTEKTILLHDNEHHPALLFVREKDLLSCLRNAIQIESMLGTVVYHTGIRVDGITNVDGDLGSLLLRSTVDGEVSTTTNEDSARTQSPQYNLIIAADGLYSSLRARFAGHHSIHATGGIGSSSSSSSRASSFSSLDEKSTVGYKWEHTHGQREATVVEDREYIVFRGNAPKLPTTSCEDKSGVSFQTWGEKDSMRFAAVPFRHRMRDYSLQDGNNSGNNNFGRYSESQAFMNSKMKEEEVWFATISDPTFINIFKASSSNHDTVIDANRMKRLLLDAFGSWHQPIKTLIETTPSEEIMFELAIAHCHSAGPVCDVGKVLEFERWQATMNRKMNVGGGTEITMFPPDDDGGKINGCGPILVFIGDAMMTVDPVLAQGFTIAMESGASIVQSIERILIRQHLDTIAAASSSSSVKPPPIMMYHPKLLRDELVQRHYHRERRLLQLLRSTELVQRMAQPHGLVSTLLATWIVRPFIKLCPDGLKKGVFDYMIRYSLGLTGNAK